MGAHLIEEEFQSDKYPTCPRGKVPLSVKDLTAQDLLWEYAQRRRSVDREFAEDLEAALILAGYKPRFAGGALREFALDVADKLVERDNGYMRCLACDHEWHMDDEPRHDEECVLLRVDDAGRLRYELLVHRNRSPK